MADVDSSLKGSLTSGAPIMNGLYRADANQATFPKPFGLG
jgi:hypothetical protein